jgi:hypothetical protein
MRCMLFKRTTEHCKRNIVVCRTGKFKYVVSNTVNFQPLHCQILSRTSRDSGSSESEKL